MSNYGLSIRPCDKWKDRLTYVQTNNSLKALQKLTRKNYLKAQFKGNKKWVKYFMLATGLGFFTYLLTDISWNFIVLTLLSALAALVYLAVICIIAIKLFLVVRKHNVAFEKFINQHAHTPIVSYHLKEDTLDYKGASALSCHWSEFLSIRDDEDSFWLMTEKVERNDGFPNWE